MGEPLPFLMTSKKVFMEKNNFSYFKSFRQILSRRMMQVTL